MCHEKDIDNQCSPKSDAAKRDNLSGPLCKLNTRIFEENSIRLSLHNVGVTVVTCNPMALREAKIVCSFGLSDCNRVNSQ